MRDYPGVSLGHTHPDITAKSAACAYMDESGLGFEVGWTLQIVPCSNPVCPYKFYYTLGYFTFFKSCTSVLK